MSVSFGGEGTMLQILKTLEDLERELREALERWEKSRDASHLEAAASDVHRVLHTMSRKLRVWVTNKTLYAISYKHGSGLKMSRVERDGQSTATITIVTSCDGRGLLKCKVSEVYGLADAITLAAVLELAGESGDELLWLDITDRLVEMLAGRLERLEARRTEGGWQLVVTVKLE